MEELFKRSGKVSVINFARLCVKHSGNIEKIVLSLSFVDHLGLFRYFFEREISQADRSLYTVLFYIDNSLDSINCNYQIHLKGGVSPISEHIRKRVHIG
jgi:hypothetical protein